MDKDFVGKNYPHHFAIGVIKGQMDSAVKFFTEFLGGWWEKARRFSKTYGESRYVETSMPDCPKCLIGIHLIEVSGYSLRNDGICHIAFSVNNPDLTAKMIVKNYPGSSAESFSGILWVVEIPSIFTMPFELVYKE